MDITAIQEIINEANKIVTWCISIFGGTLVALLSTSYAKPPGKYGKYSFLLFIPGWWFLGTAIYWGDSIARRGIIARMSKADALSDIAQTMNTEFISLSKNFAIAMIAFATWLVVYLLLTVFSRQNPVS